jgi:hypothetical protein
MLHVTCCIHALHACLVACCMHDMHYMHVCHVHAKDEFLTEVVSSVLILTAELMVSSNSDG